MSLGGVFSGLGGKFDADRLLKSRDTASQQKSRCIRCDIRRAEGSKRKRQVAVRGDQRRALADKKALGCAMQQCVSRRIE